MNQPQFTLQELNDLRNDLYLLSEERFHYYFRHLYGWTKEQCAAGFNTIKRFPYRLHEEDYAQIEKLLPLVKEVLALIVPVHRGTLSINNDDYQKYKLKVIYRENNNNQEIVVDFCRAGDIIAYAALLQRGIEVITQLEYVESIRAKDTSEKDLDVFVGDIFLTEKGGQYEWERCRTQYIICMGGNYYKLLYTEGKGYVRDGKPDYDKKEACNFHVITFEDNYRKVGNAFLDMSFLVDNNNSKTEK